MSPQERRRRGAAESLASIVLGSESLIVFLAGLVIFGLDAMPAGIPAWWGIVAGCVLALLMLATSPLLNRPVGIALGWAWQVVLALGGILQPALAIVALIFGAMYGYATIKGAALDRQNAQRTPSESNGD